MNLDNIGISLRSCIYCIGLAALIFSMATKYVDAHPLEESAPQEIFWPPDMIPHPHPPQPKDDENKNWA